MTCHNMTGSGGVMTTSASEMHTRRIGLATCNQSAFFMTSIKWYYCQYSKSATCNSLKTLAMTPRLHR